MLSQWWVLSGFCAGTNVAKVRLPHFWTPRSCFQVFKASTGGTFFPLPSYVKSTHSAQGHCHLRGLSFNSRGLHHRSRPKAGDFTCLRLDMLGPFSRCKRYKMHRNQMWIQHVPQKFEDHLLPRLQIFRCFAFPSSYRLLKCEKAGQVMDLAFLPLDRLDLNSSPRLWFDPTVNMTQV